MRACDRSSGASRTLGDADDGAMTLCCDDDGRAFWILELLLVVHLTRKTTIHYPSTSGLILMCSILCVYAWCCCTDEGADQGCNQTHPGQTPGSVPAKRGHTRP